MGRLYNTDPIFFYHKSVKTLSVRGFDGVVTPSAKMGGPAFLLLRYEEIAAYNTNNHLPLMWRFYSPNRKGLFSLVSCLDIHSTSADESVIEALKFILENEGKRGKYLPFNINLNFINKNWQNLVIKEVEGTQVLVRQQLEICVFSYLANELKTGDACVVGSESYADFREQLLTVPECEPLVEEYCSQLGFPANPEAFVEYLRSCLALLATQVDVICADGKQFTINQDGEPVLKRLKSPPEPKEVQQLEEQIRSLMPERSVLDILCNVEHWLNWTKHFGPLSANEPKFKLSAERYIFTAFGYGCALFTHFITCGVWEAVYILDGLLKNISDIQPDTLYADSQGQSGLVFALSYLLGIKLMPRIRNWKELSFLRPYESATYKYIDPWFKEVANWNLIQLHWYDMMRVVLSIKAGKVMPSTL